MTPIAETARIADVGETPSRLGPLTMVTVALTGLADFLFWGSAPGANVGVFFAGLSVIVIASRRRTSIEWRTWLALALLFGACIQAANELCITNVCVLVALLAMIAGGTFYTRLPHGWARWVEQLSAFALCVTRLPWLVAMWLRRRPQDRPLNLAENVAQWLLIALPAIVLVVVFGGLLGEGNTIFGDYAKRTLTVLSDWVRHLDFSAMRLFFWLVAASFVLACLRPHSTPLRPAVLSHEPGRWMRGDPDFARRQSIVALIAVNLLFLAANSVDVVFLWMHRSIPDGVNAKDYIHAGVNNLIVATVLAAMVITVIFQQQPEVSRSRLLRALAQLWIVQNCVLAAGVYLRDWLYVMESHLLTEKRIYVACFLALVLVGYGFLAIHIRRGTGIGLLMRRNAAVTFALFYVIQFLDVGGFAANWSAARYLKDPSWGFDVNYWATQGPSAWPALVTISERKEGRDEAGNRASALVAKLRGHEAGLKRTDWRATQFRRDHQRAILLGETDANGR